MDALERPLSSAPPIASQLFDMSFSPWFVLRRQKAYHPRFFFQGEIKLANISRKKFFLAVNIVHGKDMVKLEEMRV